MTCLKKEKEIELSLYNDVGTLASYNKYIEATKGDISVIYMDNAATTMHKPKAVIDAVVAAMSSMGNAGRGANEASLSASRIIYDTRERLAKLFGAENPKQIVFTMNSTESLNIAIKGSLNPGDHVITTQLEHNSVLRPLYAMQKKGVELTIAASGQNGTADFDAIEAAIQANTKAIVCTHASNLTGNLTDMPRMGELAKRHGLFLIVDASQTAGVIPIDVKQMHIDVLCFTGHKSLFGPQGTGGLYIGEGAEIKPLKSGGTGVHSFLKTQPEELPEHLEAGTLNGHGIAGLLAGVQEIQKITAEEIWKKERNLMECFVAKIKQIPNMKIYGDFSDKNRCPIVSLNIAGVDSSQVSEWLLEEYEIAVRPGAHCAPLMHQYFGTQKQGMVRFSFSYYNTEKEALTAAEAIREIAEEVEA